MKKQIIIYGLAIGLLVIILQLLEYKLLVRNISPEVYVGLAGILFTVLGIWIGTRIIIRQKAKDAISEEEKENVIKAHELSKRELEVLNLIAEGKTNAQIGESLFVSESTIKTHTSNLFSKLGVSRRTEAIIKAKDLGLLD